MSYKRIIFTATTLFFSTIPYFHLFAQDIIEHFDSDTLSNIWSIESPGSVTYSLGNGRLRVFNIVDGGWGEGSLIAPFGVEENANYKVSFLFVDSATSYQQFHFDLLDSELKEVVSYDIFNHWSGNSTLWIEVDSTYVAHLSAIPVANPFSDSVLIERTNNFVRVFWNGSVRDSFPSTREPVYVRLLFREWSGIQFVINIDYISADANQRPTINPIEPKSVSEGSILSFELSAWDVDSDSIVLEVINLPTNANFIDSGNGAAIFTFSPDTTQSGIYNVIIRASDGNLADSLPVQITVMNCDGIAGDANESGSLSLADVIATVNYVFNKPGFPSCTANSAFCWLSELLCRGDWSGGDGVNLSDIIRGVNYIFNKPGGPWAPLPSGACCLPVP